MMARVMILTAGALMLSAGFAQANPEEYPTRGNFFYMIGFRQYPAVLPSSQVAPWYLWWPADATAGFDRTDFQTSPYPTWPSSPPTGFVAPRTPGQTTSGPYQQVPYQPTSGPRGPLPSYPYGR